MPRYCYAIDDPEEYSDHTVYVFGCDVPPDTMAAILNATNAIRERGTKYKPNTWVLTRASEEAALVLGNDAAFEQMCSDLVGSVVYRNTGVEDAESLIALARALGALSMADLMESALNTRRRPRSMVTF